MIRATVKKLDGTYLDHSNFASEEAAFAWFQPFIDKGVYGKKQVPAQYQEIEITPEVLDGEGNIISPAVTESVLVAEEVPAEFVIDFAPIVKTQQEINEEARAFLSSTDWMTIRHSDELLAGDTPSLSEEELQSLLAQRKAARESVV